MENYDWNLFWTAFGAIGTVLGSIATTAAVIVALWQTRIAYKKKLKLSFDDNTKIMADSGTIIADFVSLSVTNIGNKDIVISSWGFYLKNKSKVKIFSNLPIENLPLLLKNEFITKFPYKLSVEHSTTFYYERRLFLKIIPEYYENGELDADKPIKFYVMDSTGKEYTVKSKRTAKECCFPPKRKSNN